MKEGMDFREFIQSSELGGTGNRYEFGKDPMEIKETTKDLLVHINTLSAAALNKIENSKIDSENAYIKRQLIKDDFPTLDLPANTKCLYGTIGNFLGV